MKILWIGLLLISASLFFSCKSVTSKDISDLLESGLSSRKALTESEVVAGLKEALKIGTERTVSLSSVSDGFWKNPLIKIPLPEKFNPN